MNACMVCVKSKADWTHKECKLVNISSFENARKAAFSLLSTAKSSQLQHFGRLTKGYYRVTSLEQLSLAEFSGE